MDVRHLRAMVAVAEHLNFSRAASAIYVSQPALSTQINELEADLGVKLFERSSRAVLLTEEGCIVLERAKEILKAIDNLVLDGNTGKLKRGGQKKLRFAGERNASLYDTSGITKRQQEFICAHPDIIVETLHIPFDGCTQALLADSVDACVMVFWDGRGLDPALNCKVLFRDNLCLLYAEKYGELTVEQLVEKLGFYYTIDRDPQNLKAINTLENMNLHPRVTRVGNQQGSLICAQMGLSFTAHPQRLTAGLAIDGIRTIPLKPEFGAGIEHKLVWKKGNHNPALQAFIDWFAEL